MADNKVRRKSKKEFSDDYTLGKAFQNGSLYTRLSAVILGFGNMMYGQIVKGILFLALEIAYFIFMFSTGFAWLGGFFKLGGQNSKEIWDDEVGSYINTPQDYTVKFLLMGVIAIAITALFIFLWKLSVCSSYKAECETKEGKRPATFVREVKDLADKNLHKTLLALPLTGIIAFTILPLIFMICMAFTNYDNAHPNVFNWTGLAAFGKTLNLKGAIGQEFWSVLGWTLIWAVAATFSNYILGMILAIIINRKDTKCKTMWRFFFMMSAAIPQFVSLLLMRTLFEGDGIINTVFGTSIQFWQNPGWSRALIILINIWIGVPFTMLQVTGVLQNIPSDLYEAARVDGAGPITIFFKITLPYMLFVTAPYLITSFTGNINNFNVIFLLSGGGPSRDNLAATSGKTDLLVTWLYKLTISNADKMYNIAAVIGILTFVIMATVSLLTYHRTGSYKNEEGFQ